MEETIYYAKIIGLVLAVGGIGFLIWVLAVFVASNLWALVVVLLLAAALVGGLSWLAFCWIQEKIEAHRKRVRLHRLEVKRQEASIEAEAEQRRLEAERWRFDAWYKAEQLRQQAEQQSLLHFRDNEVLARRLPGGGVDIAYVPMPRIAGRIVAAGGPDDTVIVSEATIEALPAPRRVPGAGELIEQGRIGAEGEILLGFDGNMQEVRRLWKKIKAVLILGLQGGGKTSTAVWLIVQVLMQGGRIALIDKHARSEDDSMYQKVKPFEPLFDTPVGDSPQAGLRVIAHARKVLDARLDGAPCSYPLLLVVDEFSAIMRQLKTDEKWAEVASKLAALVEDFNFEGRKHKCYAVCIGQAANASRTGGTEVRDTFNTRLVHGMRAKQASLIGLTEQKKDVQKLENGQLYVDIEGADDPFFVQVPFVSDEDIQTIAAHLIGARRRTESLGNGAFLGRSMPVQSQSLERSERKEERHANAHENYAEPLNAQAQKVFDLKKLNMGKAAIIWEVWGVKKGGSERYKQAELDYEQIVENLVNLGYLKVN